MDADMTIRDVMTREFVGVSESDSVLSTARLLLAEDADCAVVLRGNEPVGVLTERDVLATFVEDDEPDIDGVTVAEAMNGSVASIPANRDFEEAIDRLSSTTTDRLLVIENGSNEPIGLLTHRDVTAAVTHAMRLRATPYEDAEADANGIRSEFGTAESTPVDAIQSICEACGSLSRSLMNVDGQLVCPDCRDV